MDEFLKISYTLSPLLVGLAFHGLCIRFGWLVGLARPIDAGATLRDRPLFGPNKTYRGVIAVALGTAGGVGLQVLLHRIGFARTAELLTYTNPAVRPPAGLSDHSSMCSTRSICWLGCGLCSGLPSGSQRCAYCGRSCSSFLRINC